MKSIKPGSKLTMKVSLPEDLPWKIFGSLLKDLGFTNECVEVDSEPYLANKEHVTALLGCVRSRDPQRLLTFVPSIQPQCMLSATGSSMKEAYAFFAHYQAGAFLKKFPFKGTDTLQPAILNFEKAERVCGLYNAGNYRALLALNDQHPDYLSVVEDLQKDIEGLLGTSPKLESIYGLARHGPGTSLGPMYKKGKTTAYYKWSQLPYSVTKDALAHAKEAISTDPRWIGALDDWYRNSKSIPIGMPINMEDFWSSVFIVVGGSKITTVPKTALTDRTIAIEPLLNVFLQLGVDGVLRGKLKSRWGIDLNTQVHNQKLAQESSVTNDMATVDLSMASDTISLKICELLLPGAWYALLLDLRSPTGVFEGKEYLFEKISSMGNGYTFVLETVIFAAITRCAIKRTGSKKRMAVYGDDIVLPSTAFSYLTSLLNLCGFQINEEKSFDNGPFRESCGSDFYLGHNVRPLALKRKLSSVQDLFYVHNSLWALQDRLNWAWNVDFSSTLALIKKYIPEFYRDNFRGPPGEQLDTYLFSKRVLRRNSYGEQVYNYIRCKARRYRGPEFFFRKLMCNLKQVVIADFSRSWKKKRPSSGNAFEVTKRDAVLFVSARCRIP